MHLATEAGEFYFSLQSQGTTIFLDTRTPTERELHECPHVQMTSKLPWDPHTVRFPDLPRREEEEESQALRRVYAIRQQKQASPDECFCAQENVCPCPQRIVDRLISQVQVPEVLTDVPGRRTFVSNERHSKIGRAHV